MAEAWNKYYTDEEIETIHRIELESLDVVEHICSILDVNFIMYGGSLLGAIKYGGFVPWDDDLDIAMLREDYERFISEGPRLLPDMYEIQHPRLNKKTPYPYVKFRRTDTKLVEYGNHKININHGVYFDIYPIDRLPDNYIDYLSQKLQYDKWVGLFLLRQNFRIGKRIESIKDFVHISIRAIESLCLHVCTVDYFMKKIDQISMMYDDTNASLFGNLSYPKPINYFDDISFVKCHFEGRQVYIPGGYKINLKNRYGDVNRLPPEKDRVGHKAYILELNKGE